MKYQDILNGKLLFETNDVSEFYKYLLNKENKSTMYSVLYQLLEKSNGYICNMATANR